MQLQLRAYLDQSAFICLDVLSIRQFLSFMKSIDVKLYNDQE